MGTTLDALRAGSVRLSYTVLIEGYRYILTDGDPAAAVAAHAGSDHVGALGGLFVDMENEQTLNPWNPFPTGGSCTLTVLPTPGQDTFGIDTHRRDTGAETQLTATANRTGSINVKDTSAFTAPGEAHIGTECFAYTGTSPTLFSGVTRGMYEAFGSNTFAEHHRAGLSDAGPKREPLVTEYPRVWIGRWVGVYAHRVVDGVLDVFTEAQLVFAGKIDSIADDISSGGTVVDLRHVLDVVRETTIGNEPWSGRLAAGVNLEDGDSLKLHDDNGTAQESNALTATVGASGANQLEPGLYTHEQLHTKINAWLASELDAARIHGTYTMSASDGDGVIRTKIHFTIPAASSTVNVDFQLYMPARVATFLGFTVAASAGPDAIVYTKGEGFGNIEDQKWAENPLRLLVIQQRNGAGNTAEILEERGEFYDNYALLPSAVRPGQNPLSLKWGLFLVNDTLLVKAARNGTDLEFVWIEGAPFGTIGAQSYSGPLTEFAVEADVHNITSVSIRQVIAIEMQFAKALKAFFYSTGTTGYNSVANDTLGHGLGLGIPADLLGSEFDLSCSHLPGAYSPIIAVIEKPTKFADLFSGDMILRCSFLRWSNGALDVCQWRTPLEGHAEVELTEANKAAPVGTQDNHRTAARESAQWQRPVVRILYNRDITDLDGTGYRRSITLQDSVAIDDAGGNAADISIRCRNTYGQYANTGAGVETLAPGFLAIWPLFSRPARLLSRSIDSTNFEGLTIGDCVTVTDLGARDPDTGQRGISVRPAIVVKHWSSFGGLIAGNGDKPSDPGGNVELLLLDSNRVKKYGPAADVDSTYSSGGFSAGYNSATNTLRCQSHRFSSIIEAVDASWFAVNYEVTIIEIDPADPDAPLTWTRSVKSVSGSDIELETGVPLGGYDTTKRYRVTFADFGTAIEAQRSFAYHADDAYGLINNTAPPHEYAVGWPARVFVNRSASDQVELVPNPPSVDAASRDVGHDLAMASLVENLNDYKLTIQTPLLSSTIATNAGGSAPAFKLVMIAPIFLTSAGLSNEITRALSVAPFYRAAASALGASVSCRISLVANPPSGASFDVEVDRGAVYAEATWSSASTTWQTGAGADLDIGSVKQSSGNAYLLVEISPHAETRGIARCVEGPRVYS